MNKNIHETVQVLPSHTRFVGLGKTMRPTHKWKDQPEKCLGGNQIWQLANAGVILSSANLMVIDLDNHDGKMTNKIKPLASELFHMCPTFMVKTKSKGYHLYYMKPTGVRLNKTTKLRLDGEILGDFKVGDTLTFIGKGYTTVRNDGRIPQIRYANMAIIKWIKEHTKVKTPIYTNPNPPPDGLFSHQRDTTYNPPEGWMEICRMDDEARQKRFRQLLQNGERHNKMIGFTWFYRKNNLNPIVQQGLMDFQIAFFAAFDNQGEALKEWRTREYELDAMTKKQYDWRNI